MISFTTRVILLHGTAAVFICIISYIYSQGNSETTLTDPLIFAGVISARDNSDYRRAIRDTWGKWAKEPHFDLKFVIGRECSVHPDDRAFDQGCAETVWPHGNNYGGVYWSNSFTPSLLLPPRSFKGFSFIVNHPVVLQSVKLANWAQARNKTTVRIVSAHTQDELDSLDFPRFSADESELGTQRYLLPRGFEGIVYLEEVGQATPITTCHKWSDHGRFVEYTWVIDKDAWTWPAGTSSACVPVAIGFVFSGIEAFLEERLTRSQLWSDHLAATSLSLAEEKGQYNDILFVETVDVYRNLTSKMLDLYRWVALKRNDAFFLKVDDDTFVDLETVGKHVKMVAAEARDEIWWWGDIRERWAVSRFSKWRDNVHLSASYPPFPCGAAYLLSPRFASFLGTSSPSLTKYPFEDTALGLWTHFANLSPILGQSKECKMSCEEQRSDCNPGFCFKLQNSPNDMYRLMDSYEDKGFLC